MKEAKYIWMDGELVAWNEAKVHVLTHTLHYGNAVFEGTRAYQTEDGLAIFRLDEHTKRLYNSAKIVAIKPNFDYEKVREAHIELLKSNDFTSNVYVPSPLSVTAPMVELPVCAIVTAAPTIGLLFASLAVTVSVAISVSLATLVLWFVVNVVLFVSTPPSVNSTSAVCVMVVPLTVAV